VTSLDDSGPGTLRQAIHDVCESATIALGPDLTGGTIALAAPLVLTRSVTIDGTGPEEPVTLSGEGAHRVLEVPGGTSATVRGVTISQGYTVTDGGAVQNLGALLLERCTLRGNEALGGGGALWNNGLLVIQDSALVENEAGGDGGALLNVTMSVVVNSTLALNSAQGNGGGLSNAVGGLVGMVHSTLAGNSAGSSGAGVHNLGTLDMANTILAGRPASDACANNGTLITDEGNLVEDASCGTGLAVDPLLGLLGNHGGSTETYALLPGSPAINAAEDSVCLAMDQRGVSRPQGADCDIGAYELRPATATTAPPAGVGPREATLQGAVTAPDLAGVTFDYGINQSYGMTVTAQPAVVTATVDGPVSATVSGLLPNTVYHYRVVASGAEVVAGENVTFTTAAVPPTVSTGEATGLTGDGATLHGTANAENAETTVAFEYGLDTAYGETLDATPAMVTGIVSEAVTCTVTGLLPNTTYHYRAVGTNVGGPAYGEDRAFATAPVAPVVATDSAGDVTEASAVLHGTVNARNDETAVAFRYGLVSGAYEHTATTESVAGLEDTLVSAALSGLAPNTTYYYRVEAANAGGETYGEERTFATGLAAPVALTEPADGITETGATLRATVNARNADTAIHFQYGLGTAYGETAVADPDTVSGLDDATASAVLAGLAPSTTYHFRVVATNGAGATYGEDATFTTGQVAPLATTEDATEVTGTGATLHGTVNAQNDDATILFEYGLDDAYGESAPADPATASGSGDTAVSCVLTGLLPGATYHFRVVATNGAGTTEGEDRTLTTAAVAPVSTTGAAGDVTISGAMLHGTVNAQNSVTDAWFEYAPGDAAWESAPAEPASVSGMGDVAVTLALADLAPDTLYRYRVVAENAGGITTGETMTFTTGIPVPVARTEAATEIGTTTAILHATVNGLGQEVAVRFEYGPDTRYGASIAAAQTPLTVAADTAVTAALEGLAPGTTYHYRVVAESAGGLAEGEDLTFTTATDEPHAPVYLVYLPLARP
jgi:phosphodiesterase/alkaline phosphatase D-like protein